MQIFGKYVWRHLSSPSDEMYDFLHDHSRTFMSVSNLYCCLEEYLLPAVGFAEAKLISGFVSACTLAGFDVAFQCLSVLVFDWCASFKAKRHSGSHPWM